MKETKPYDLTQLRELSDNDEEFIKTTLEMFVSRAKETFEEIDQKLFVKDYEEVGKLAHKIKPSFAYIGINDLYEEIMDIERMAKDGSEVNELTFSIGRFKEKLTKYINIIEKEELTNYE